ncbi:MAG: zinc ribbon domain-containing protein [Anaerolineales bacterium]
MTLDPAILNSLILLLSGFGAAFLLALWVSLIVWTYRDIRARTTDRLSHILAVLLTAILNLPGLVLYLLLRPAQTLEEAYQRSLEEEMILQALEAQAQCPGCERTVDAAWIICPTCRTRLKKTCPSCQRLLELAWDLCPYCGWEERKSEPTVQE